MTFQLPTSKEACRVYACIPTCTGTCNIDLLSKFTLYKPVEQQHKVMLYDQLRKGGKENPHFRYVSYCVYSLMRVNFITMPKQKRWINSLIQWKFISSVKRLHWNQNYIITAIKRTVYSKTVNELQWMKQEDRALLTYCGCL